MLEAVPLGRAVILPKTTAVVGNDQIPAPEADVFLSYSICDYICAMLEESICFHNYCLIFIAIQTFKH